MEHLTEASPANILIIAGIVFLAVGVFGKIGGYIGNIIGTVEAGGKARLLSGVLGGGLLITGIVFHAMEERPAAAPDTATTAPGAGAAAASEATPPPPATGAPQGENSKAGEGEKADNKEGEGEKADNKEN